MELLPIAVFVGLFLVWAVTAARAADDHQIEAMATMYGIPLSPDVVVRLRARVLMLRRWRLVGGVLGVSVGLAVALATPLDVSISSMLFSVAVGYGVAAVGAELADARRRSAGPIALAGVRARDLRTTIGPWAALPCLVAALIVGACIAVNAIWRPGASALIAQHAVLSTRALVALSIGYVALLAAAVLSLRTIIRAPERGDHPADHVVQRASKLVAVMTVLGATWMILGALGSIVVWPIWVDRPDNGLLTFLVLLIALYIGLSGPMGFIATVSTLPRNRPFRRTPRSLARQPEHEAVR